MDKIAQLEHSEPSESSGFSRDQNSLVLPIHIATVDAATKIGHVNGVAACIDLQSNRFVEVTSEDLVLLRRGGLEWSTLCIESSAIQRITERNFTTISPVERVRGLFNFEVNGLWEVLEDAFHIGSGSCRFAGRSRDIGTEDTSLATLRWPLLGPVKLAQLWSNSYTNTPAVDVLSWVGILRVACRHKSLKLRAIKVASVDTTPFAVAEIDFLCSFVQSHLLWSVYSTGGDDSLDSHCVWIE